MARPCECRAAHARRRIVLTGGPGAGKTAVLELIRQSLCSHVVVLPEAAGIVFGGGFPRQRAGAARQAAQRAIYHVQLELEAVADANGAAIVLCDRGALDGAAYWPGPGEFWDAVGTTRADAFKRYASVIHLRVPNAAQGYDQKNPLRLESAVEAHDIDNRILAIWEGHPRRVVIDAEDDFLTKAQRAIDLLRTEMPQCCRAYSATAGGVARLLAAPGASPTSSAASPTRPLPATARPRPE